MTSVLKTAQAGTLESNDIMITVAPASEEQPVTIALQSLVMAQYGDMIRETIATTLSEQGVSSAYVQVVDRGALDCTIKARLLTALERAGVAVKEAEQ